MSRAVRFCFDLVTAGTTLDGAELEIDEPRGRVACRRCGTAFDSDEVLALCPCGSADVELLRGRKLRIRSLEVAASTSRRGRGGPAGPAEGAEGVGTRGDGLDAWHAWVRETAVQRAPAAPGG